MSLIVSAQGLSKSFGTHAVLEGVGLSIGEGECLGLVGLNGAGKTTLIRLLLGILKPDVGTVSLFGSEPWLHEGGLYRRMGVVLEHDGFNGNLTVLQNLKFFAAARKISWVEASAYLDDYWQKSELLIKNKPVKFLSRGQRMQCAICRAFLGWPQLFFLDEPVVALDVDAYDHFARMVREAKSRGAALLVSSHQLDAVDDLCDRVGILRDKKLADLAVHGRKVHSGLRWALEADANARWSSIIMETCGDYAAREHDSWLFEAANPGEMIPLLIKRLVDAGCMIRRIAPAGGHFSSAIRNEYRRGGNGESAA
ncbi:MAG: ABC transporter ATP-binding protein [Chitinispirillaceae bacterium]|jgi:ABC-type multidrug transport system ATPase subunit|nr:ABC transporter ATP-binding protein [Chitinispirillaceae bacterium]